MRRICFFSIFLLTARAEREYFQGYHIKVSTVTKDVLLREEEATGRRSTPAEDPRARRSAPPPPTHNFSGAFLFHARPPPRLDPTDTTEATLSSPSTKRLIIRHEENISTADASTEPPRSNFLWLRTPSQNPNETNTHSVTLTSFASHPPQIENLPPPPPLFRADDKRSRGEDGARASKLEKPTSSIAPSIFPSAATEDSGRRSGVTRLCLTCLEDRRAASAENSVALTSDGSSLSRDELPLDSNQFPTSSRRINQQSDGEREQIQRKEMNHHNMAAAVSVYSRATAAKTQNLLNNSQHAGAAATPALSLKNTAQSRRPTQSSVAERSPPATAEPRRSSQSTHAATRAVKNEQIFGKEASFGELQSKLIHFSENIKNASQSFTTDFKNAFAQKSVRNPPTATAAPLSSQKNTAHRTVTPSTSAVRKAELRPLTGKTHPLISVLTGQTTHGSHTKEPGSTLLAQDFPAESVTTVKRLTGRRAPPSGLVKELSTHRSGSITETSHGTTLKVAQPAKLANFSTTTSESSRKHSKESSDGIDDNLPPPPAPPKHKDDLMGATPLVHGPKLADTHQQMPSVRGEDEVKDKQPEETELVAAREEEEDVKGGKMENRKEEEKIINPVTVINQSAVTERDVTRLNTAKRGDGRTAGGAALRADQEAGTRGAAEEELPSSSEVQRVPACHCLVTRFVSARLGDAADFATEKPREVSSAVTSDRRRPLRPPQKAPLTPPTGELIHQATPPVAQTPSHQPFHATNLNSETSPAPSVLSTSPAGRHSVKTSVPGSIIHGASDHPLQFITLISEEMSPLHATDGRRRAEHITPPPPPFRVKDPLTSKMIEEVNKSSSARPSLTQQDSSSRSPGAVAAAAARVSTGGAPLHQGQHVPQISPSPSSSPSSSDTTRCSPLELPERTANANAPPARLDDNEQRSVQTLMAPMSPKAKNDQFALSGGVSPLLRLTLFEGDGLPATSGRPQLTRQTPESGSQSAGVSLGSAEEANRSGGLSAAGEIANQNSGVTAPAAVDPKAPDQSNISSIKEENVAKNETHQSQLDKETHDTTMTLNEDSVLVTGDFSAPLFATNQAAGLGLGYKKQGNGMSGNELPETRRPPASGANSPLPTAPSGAPSGPSPQQMKNVITGFQTTLAKSSDSTSLAANGVIVSAEAHESALTTTPSVRFVIEKSSRAARGEDITPASARVEPAPMQPPSLAAAAKLAPAAMRKNTSGEPSVEQPEHDISTVTGSQRASFGVTAAARPISDPERRIRAEGARETILTVVKGGGLSPSGAIEAAVTTMSALVGTSEAPTGGRAGRAQKSSKHSEGTAAAAPPTGVSPSPLINGTNGSASPGATAVTSGTGEIDRGAPEEMSTTDAANGRDHSNARDLRAEDSSRSSNGRRRTPGNPTPQAAARPRSTPPSPLTPKSDGFAVDSAAASRAKAATDGAWSEARRAPVDDVARGGTPEEEEEEDGEARQRSSHTETSGARGVTSPVPEGGASTSGREQNGSGSAAVAAAEGGRRLLQLDEARGHRRRRAPPHLYLPGVSEVSEEQCGSGNYTAEMSLNLGGAVEPGDAVPALGNLRVVINLKTNNSRVNLGVTSCCLSPGTQPELSSATCCLFSRLAGEPAGITLLPSALSTSASFTISLFQMINYSVVYLHCDLSVCLRNRSDCERLCLQQRAAVPSEGPQTIGANLRNRISFGPMLKEVKNSTFPGEIDPSQLDLVLVVVSMVMGSSVVTVTLLLVWLAYRRWVPRPPPPRQACCCGGGGGGCLRRRGDDSMLP